MSFTVLTDEIRRARVEHRCIWCGETINAGDRYHYQSGLMDGDIQGNHWHCDCLTFAQSECSDLEDGFDAYEQERGTEGVEG